MSEADDVFITRIEDSNVYYKEFEDFLESCNKGEAISGISNDEMKSILKTLADDMLDYSNDTVIDMIIKKVLSICSDDELRKILTSIKIADLNKTDSIGRAYPKYYDGSYYIEVDRKYLKRIMLLADYVAVNSMIHENDNNITGRNIKDTIGNIPDDVFKILILSSFKEVMLERFVEDEEFSKKYNDFSLQLILFEKIHGEYITENFIKRANNIFEAAVAQFIGHEIGHHYYGHTDDNKRVEEKAIIEQDYDLDEVKQLHFFEFQADAFGTDFAIDYMQNQNGELCNTVCVHQLVGVFVPLIVSMYDTENIWDDSSSHPALWKRILRVKLALKHRTDDKLLDYVFSYVIDLLDVLGIYNKIDMLSKDGK